MSRSARIAGVALAVGVLAAGAVAVALREPPSQKAQPALIETRHDDPLRREMARCRHITMPDAGCEHAWEEHRRRFLGRGRDDVFVPVEPVDPSAGTADLAEPLRADPAGAETPIGKDAFPMAGDE